MNIKDYSDEVKPLSKRETAWIARLEKCLLACPTDRILLSATGDANLNVLDGAIVKKYDLDIHDWYSEAHGVVLADIRSKPQIAAISA